MEKDTVQRCDTKKELIEAFWKLYAEKPVAKISVGSLCQLAGYNRTTFYNHFKDIYDLLEQTSGDIFLTVRDEVLSENNFRDILSGNMIETIFLNGFVRQHEHIELLFKRHDYYILGEKVKKEFLSLLKKEFSSEDIDMQAMGILLEYQISAVLGVVNYWCRQGKSISEQDILKTIYEISSKGFLNSLRFQLGEALV